MKLIAQLDNATIEIYCDTWQSVYLAIEKWERQGYYHTEAMKIIPYHSVKFFTVEEIER